jgi:hypothetical protein
VSERDGQPGAPAVLHLPPELAEAVARGGKTVSDAPDPTVPSWDLGRADDAAVPLARWGKDHWSALLYVEDAWVNHQGSLDADHMRTDRARHQALFLSGYRARVGFNAPGGGAFATRLKPERRREDGTWGVQELAGHDDWDCLDDMIRAGVVEVRMPVPDREAGHYVDARGRTVPDQDGRTLFVGPVSGMVEDWLMTRACFHLTPLGRDLAAQARAHKAQGLNLHQFEPRGLPDRGAA